MKVRPSKKGISNNEQGILTGEVKRETRIIKIMEKVRKFDLEDRLIA